MSVAVIYPSIKWILQINRIFPCPIIHTINAHAPNIKILVRVTTGTLVVIRLHKKGDLLETKINNMIEMFTWTT